MEAYAKFEFFCYRELRRGKYQSAKGPIDDDDDDDDFFPSILILDEALQL